MSEYLLGMEKVLNVWFVGSGGSGSDVWVIFDFPKTVEIIKIAVITSIVLMNFAADVCNWLDLNF